MKGPDAGQADDAGVGALIDEALAGSERAFELLVERKRDLVLRVALLQCRDLDEARAVAQDVFVRLWRGLDRFDRSRRFDTWLYQVTVNAAIDRHRRDRPRRLEDELDDSFQAGTGEAGPERQALLQEIRTIMTELSGELTEKQRAAFVLREVEGLSTAEVAAALGTTESTVRNHVFQARRLLRDALAARYPEYCPRGAGGEP